MFNKILNAILSIIVLYIFIVATTLVFCATAISLKLGVVALIGAVIIYFILASDDTVKVALDDFAYMPARAHKTDAGLDLYSPTDAIIPPRGRLFIDTGVHIEIPRGAVGFIKSRSGLNTYYGLSCEGVIDADYTGSIGVTLFNNTDEYYYLSKGDRIAQLVILSIRTLTPKKVKSLVATERGSAGFGSTGR